MVFPGSDSHRPGDVDVLQPRTHTAWESVFYLQHEIPMGWWIRGIHYWAAECMVVASFLLLILYISSIGSAASNHRSYLRALGSRA